MEIKDPRPAEPAERFLKVLTVLQRIWTYAITTKSDYSREYADELAEAASRGFVTTEITPGSNLYGRLWKITALGLSYLARNSHSISDQEEQAYEAHCAG
jgi:hypothetical protein